MLSVSVYAEEYEKACQSCDFVILEKLINTGSCKEYHKYFFQNKKIGRAYEEFCVYFIPNHKYAEFWKRYLPDSNEKYIVKKEYVDNSTVTMFYEVIPKKSFRDGKKVNIDMIIDNEKYHFQLREIDKNTEIISCYNNIE